MAKRVLWLCRDWDTDESDIILLVWHKPETRGNDEWSIVDAEVMCKKKARRAFGVLPRVNQTICISMEECEYYCPGCKDWTSKPVLNLNPDDTVMGRYCPACEGRFTRTRNRVLERISLKEAAKNG